MGKMNVDLITVSLQCSVEGFFFFWCAIQIGIMWCCSCLSRPVVEMI